MPQRCPRERRRNAGCGRKSRILRLNECAASAPILGNVAYFCKPDIAEGDRPGLRTRQRADRLHQGVLFAGKRTLRGPLAAERCKIGPVS